MPDPSVSHELMRRLAFHARRLLRDRPKYGSLTVKCRGPSPKRPATPLRKRVSKVPQVLNRVRIPSSMYVHICLYVRNHIDMRNMMIFRAIRELPIKLSLSTRNKPAYAKSVPKKGTRFDRTQPILSQPNETGVNRHI
ncbi:hypothetical protein PIB30_022163 [Stylosanthes scabra]|uniref:Ribosomal protein S10 n=1 Tax=Stylosanthes scabra TaxID=79078 RepID=A0ABU6V863_9FABA|nr:hypothetical protein [Stylosanthes scabra]